MKRTLIIQLARFGDLMQTKRLFLSARAEGEVHLCIDRSLEGLARLIYPEAVLHPIVAHASGGSDEEHRVELIIQNLPVFEELRNLKPDAVYNLNFSGLNFSIARLFPVENVAGYRSQGPQQLKSPWTELTFRWSRRRGGNALNIVDMWAGLHPNPVVPEQVNPVAVSKESGDIGIVLAGRNQRRSLPPEVFVRIAQALWSTNGKGNVYLLGGAGERGAAKEFLALFPATMREKVRNLAGKTDWAGLIQTVDGLDMLLTPDTGTMHLAAHLGTPVTAFFLSSALCFETGPYGEGHTVWQAVRHCLPCVESDPCPYEVVCLEPMASPEFLRYLASGKGSEALEQSLTELRSEFDALGCTYASFLGTDPWMDERTNFRSFIATHKGVSSHEDNLNCKSAALADMLYKERDWMTETGLDTLQAKL